VTTLALFALLSLGSERSSSRFHRQAEVRVPLDLLPAASASIGAAERGFWPTRDGAALSARGGRIESTFTAAGPVLKVRRGSASLRLAAFGREGHLTRLAPVAPHSAANEVTYHRAALDELYRTGPAGIEQAFALRARPRGAGPLMLALASGGSLVPRQRGSELIFSGAGAGAALRYGQLSAIDASGHSLPARIALSGRTIYLRIEDRRARYPLRIDPFVQGEKLTPKEKEETGAGGLGLSVAMSADGKTALIGARFDNGSVGAAWVFSRSGTTWSQTQKLLASGAVGEGGFGAGVALSADGKTALIGGPFDNNKRGAAWVFTRSAELFSQQAELVGGSSESGQGTFGWSVALSETGETALVGGPAEESGKGAAWVFTRSGTTWEQQRKLTGPGEEGSAEFGYSVALSGKGSLALIGGPCDGAKSGGAKLLLPCEPTVGAAWAFARSGVTWKLDGESKLTGTKQTGAGSLFGSSVALSLDGKTALIGGENDNKATGAAWVFSHPAEGTWTQEEKLTGAGETEEAFFGKSVALSGDGKTALVGAIGDSADVGAAWAFVLAGGKWTPEEPKLTGGNAVGKSLFGAGVALSEDGSTAVIGGGGDNANAGAAWIFVNGVPTIASVNPPGGPEAGGTSVRITGSNLSAVTSVKFGETAALGEIKHISPETELEVVAPPGNGTVDVLLETSEHKKSVLSERDHYTYKVPVITSVTPSAGPLAAGTPVVIKGANFAAFTSVAFNGTEGTEGSVNAEGTEIKIKAPAHEPGAVDVVVETPLGKSTTGPGDKYTFAAPPTITKVEPTKGSEAGAEVVTITGTSLALTQSVKFGEAAATGVEVNSETQLTAKSPAGKGTVDIKVTTPGGTNGPTVEDHFTYVPPPTVSKVEPNKGSEAGGTSVALTGTNLTEATKVTFGATEAKGFKVNSATSITAESPAGSSSVDVTVTTAGGTSATGEADKFSYVAPPTVTNVSPKEGPEGGGATVTVTGGHLKEAEVMFGLAPASGVKINEAGTQLTAKTPEHAAGKVDVRVKTPGGTSATSAADEYTFVARPTVAEVSPNKGPEEGGTGVTIKGANFKNASQVKFGGHPAPGFEVNAEGTQIIVKAPEGKGAADVSVTTPLGGTSETVAGDKFTYVPKPAISSVEPNKGPEGGSTSVSITGTNFSEATAVKFGATDAKSFKFVSATSITAESPAGSGTVDVSVTTAGGTSATGEADKFKFLPVPEAQTQAASAIAQTTVTLNAAVNPFGGKASVCKFEYGTSIPYASSEPCTSLPAAVSEAVAVSAQVKGLAPKTEYHFRIVAKTPGGEKAGADMTFETTAPTSPVVEGLTTLAIAQTSATLSANVNANGATVEKCTFEYGQPPAWLFSAECSPTPGKESKPVAVSAAITGLAPNTAYHFRVITENSSGPGNVVEQSFKTLPNPPAVATAEATAVTQTSATLAGSVNPNGGEVSECKLEYGPSSAYGSSAPCSSPPGAGASAVTVSAQVAGLSPATTYHFRLSATNPGGTSAGADRTFTTVAARAGAGGHAPGTGASGMLPAVTLLGRSLKVDKSGVLSVKLLCPAGESGCVGKITLRAPAAGNVAGGKAKRGAKLLTLTHAPFSLAGGQTKTLKLTLTAAARVLLITASKVRGQATISAHDLAGASAVTLTNVTIRAKR
jgi:hypothetical protein